MSLEAERGALKQDRDAVVARSLQSMAAHDSLVGARGGALEAAQAGAERSLAALREAEGELARLRSVVGGAEAEAAALRAHAAALAAAAEGANAEAAAARAENGDKLLLKTQVAHLQVDNGRLLSLLRASPGYAAVAGVVAPFASAAAAAAAAAAAGGSEEDGALEEGAQGPPLRSTYLGALPTGGEAHYLGGVPPERLARMEPVRLRGHAPFLSADRAWDVVPGLEDAYGAFADVVGGGGDGGGGGLDVELEGARWVPADAAALCSAFRQRFLQHVAVEDARALLLGLNLAWRARAAEFVAAGRAPLLRRIGELKRAAALKKPYREVMQSATISRMNVELGALRARAGAAAGVAGVAVPISDAEPHGVAFGRTVEGGGGGGGARALSPVRAFLSGVLRGDGGTSAAIATEEEEEAPPAAAPAAGERALGLSAALRSAAARLRAPAAAATGGVGQIPELPVALRRVPGSGARRLDAHESAALLENAMRAVDELASENKELGARCAALAAAARAAEREAAAFSGGAPRAAGGAHAAAAGAAFGLTGAAARPPPPPPPAHHPNAATAAAAAVATAGGFGASVASLVRSAGGPAAYASLLPPPAYLPAISRAPAWGYVITPDGALAPPLGGSGAFPPPFASRRSSAATPAAAAAPPPQLPPPAAPSSAPQTPGGGRPYTRRLSVGEAVRAAMGAAVLTVGQLGGSSAAVV